MIDHVDFLLERKLIFEDEKSECPSLTLHMPLQIDKSINILSINLINPLPYTLRNITFLSSLLEHYIQNSEELSSGNSKQKIEITKNAKLCTNW